MINATACNKVGDKGIPEGLSFWLDFLRGISALLVVFSHIRIHFLGFWIERPEASMPDWLLRSFYALTGLGHEAVIVFFVLSGFLVGTKFFPGSVYRKDEFSRYLVNRLARIWTVLIPAILISVIVSYCLYYNLPENAFFHIEPCVPSAINVISNIFFLNEGYTETVCSNKPAWSIHSEMHYYILWPLILFGFFSKKISKSAIICSLLAIFIILSLMVFDTVDKKNTLLLFPIWIAGIVVSKYKLLNIPLWILGPILVVTMVLPSLININDFWPLGDYIIAFFVVVFLIRAKISKPINFLKNLVEWLSKISFSLYMTHMIVIIVLKNFLQINFSYETKGAFIDLNLIMVLLGIFVLSILVAYIFYLAFESNTHKTRLMLNNILRKSSL
jgi:peptidoglycan/LPS O-acetylase OafA/YrhL